MAQLTISHELSSDLQGTKLQLHWLLQITKAINSNLSTKELLSIYENILREHMKVEKLVLFIHDDQWKCAMTFGVESLENAFSIIEEHHNHTKSSPEGEKWLNQFPIISPITHKGNLLAYVLIGGIGNSPIKNKNELQKFAETITNFIVVAIENNRIDAEKIRQAELKRDLVLAAIMQSMLFPVSLPNNDKIELHATYQPHQEVGGDYYDYKQLNENEFVISMADVSGKGIPAALLMSNFQANVHALIDASISLSQLVTQLNHKVYQSAKGEKFITFFIARYNQKNHELQYVNAGHNPPFIVSDKIAIMLNDGTTALGMFEQLPFINVGRLFVPPGDILHCYTDGVVETENDDGHDFGVDRMKDFLLKNNSRDMKEIHAALIKELELFKQNQQFVDDITLLSCRFKKDKK